MKKDMVPLCKLAKIIRSKNAGPFRLTFDIIFDNDQTYELVKDSSRLNKASISMIFNIEEKKILSVYAVDAARAFKITMARPIDQGSLGETDNYGCQQHVPLMNFGIPI